MTAPVAFPFEDDDEPVDAVCFAGRALTAGLVGSLTLLGLAAAALARRLEERHR